MRLLQAPEGIGTVLLLLRRASRGRRTGKPEEPRHSRDSPLLLSLICPLFLLTSQLRCAGLPTPLSFLVGQLPQRLLVLGIVHLWSRNSMEIVLEIRRVYVGEPNGRTRKYPRLGSLLARTAHIALFYTLTLR